LVGPGVLPRRRHHCRRGARGGRPAARRREHLRSHQPLDAGGVTIEAVAAVTADRAGGLAWARAAAATSMSHLRGKRMPELSRSLQPRHITMISIGGMIGAGLFVSSSAAIAATGPAIVLSYLITGTLVLLVMRMLGEMAVALPAVRSFTEFARAGLGPWAGLLAGWLYWYFWMVVVSVEGIAGAHILHGWLGWPPWLLGLLLMGAMTAVNLMSARSYGEFEFWFASIKVAAILVFIALAAAFACGLRSPGGPTFGNLTAYGGFVPRGWVAVLAGAVTVY